MKIKNLITVSIIAPLLALSLAAKADTCPTPEEFKQKTKTLIFFDKLNEDGEFKTEPLTFFTDKDRDFALKEEPVTFVGAVFMYDGRSTAKLQYGKINACLYTVTNGGEKAKFALLQNSTAKFASIAAKSDDWKKIRTNRYDCKSDNVEDCQFNLYN